MQVISSPQKVLQHSLETRKRNHSIGLVPTMGALHAGHFSLVRESTAQTDCTIVSIFVNPLQFHNSSDLANYPRNLDADIALLEKSGVDVVYCPEEQSMYAQKPMVSLDFGSLSSSMEGAFRPGHFSGVGLVVAKLFNQTRPDKAFFGLKDLQQYLLIRRLVEDLSFPIDVVGLPIVREDSGLALSSRNARLSENGKEIASHISKGLSMFKSGLIAGKQINETKSQVIAFYNGVSGLKIEYLEVVKPDTLEPKTSNDGRPVAVCIAAYVEGIRLIDNLYLR